MPNNQNSGQRPPSSPAAVPGGRKSINQGARAPKPAPNRPPKR